MKLTTPQALAGGLAVFAAVVLAPSAHAVAVAPVISYTSMGDFTFAFDASKLTPDPAGTSGLLDFKFTPSPGAAPAKITLNGLYFSSDWAVNLSSLTTTGNVVPNLSLADVFFPPAPLSPYASTVDFINNDGTGTTFTPAEATLEATNVGSLGGFNLAYFDPPGTGSSTFTFSVGGDTVFSALIAPGGQATVLDEAPGASVSATPGTGTPAVILPSVGSPVGPSAVPEASDMALLGLGALPLLGLVRARRRAARA